VVSGEFDLSGMLRRIRRLADLSQRELASAAGLSVSAVGHAEAGTRDLPVRGLVRAAAAAGLRLALLNSAGAEVAGMSAQAVRDQAGRLYPAHLDTRYGDEDWWHGTERYSREQPWYTFDRVRYTRDYWRGRQGTRDDHQVPQPGDSPAERREARRKAGLEWQREELRRRRMNGELPPPPEPWVCTCPPLCDELDDRKGKPVHAPDCACHCDVA
jgi:transcriptional regulator with XRE-family HTH domain